VKIDAVKYIGIQINCCPYFYHLLSNLDANRHSSR